MADCEYIIGNNTYTEQEFKEYLADGGLDTFIKDGSLPLTALFKTNKNKQNESEIRNGATIQSPNEQVGNTGQKSESSSSDSRQRGTEEVRGRSDEQNGSSRTEKEGITSNGNTRDENDFIHEILSKEINEREYPLISQDINGTDKQQTAKTQEKVQDRSVDGNYVKVTIENLKEIALETTKKLEDKFGDKWVEKAINFLETRSVSNAQMIGVLNAMSTKVMQDLQQPNISETKYNTLISLQRRIDNATNKISRIASIALNMRRVLKKFAAGGNINEILAQAVLTDEVRKEMQAIDESIKRIKTDEEINNATTPTNPKGTRKTGSQSSKSQTSKDELLSNVTSKADEYRQKTGRKEKNLRGTMKDIAERIKKNCK